METKDIILQKTFKLLLEKGYNGVSVSDIQQETGMARGLLYHYYSNQDNLFRLALENFLSEWFCWERNVLKDKTINELIIYTIENYNRVARVIVDSFGKWISFSDIEVLFYEAMRHHNSIKEICNSKKSERFACWKMAMLNSFGRGELKAGLNLESVTHHFIYIQDGLLMTNQAENTISETIYILEKALREFFEIIRR